VEVGSSERELGLEVSGDEDVFAEEPTMATYNRSALRSILPGMEAEVSSELKKR
jgi:hypothetical protein